MKTILLLADHPVLMKVLVFLLKEHSVIEATSAEQAIRLFMRHGKHIDLAIIDLTLPARPGLEVARLVRAEKASLPLILASSSPVSHWNQSDYLDLEQLGSTSLVLLHKPFPAAALSNAVHALLGKSENSRVTSA